MIKYLEGDFESEIANKKILVDFYADWCGPCRMMSSVLENIDEVDILKVNVDKYPIVAQQFGIISIPALLLFDNKNIVKSIVGYMNYEELKEFLK